MELARKNQEQTQLSPVEKLSQNAIVRTLAVKKFDEVAKSLPKRINETFNVPKIREMIAATGEQTVQGFIEFELIKLAERINVSGNLTDSQIEFIATNLVQMYPNETIADFKLCFEGIAMGKYIKQDKVFKLDGTEIGYAVKSYLDERYSIHEAQLKEEKEKPFEQVRPMPVDRREKIQRFKELFPDASPAEIEKMMNKTPDDWRKDLLSQLTDKGFNKVPVLSEKEIKREGRDKPVKTEVPQSFTDQEYHERITLHARWAAENHDIYTGAKKANWIPEDEWLKLNYSNS